MWTLCYNTKWSRSWTSTTTNTRHISFCNCMVDRIKHHKNYKNCCRRRQPSWYDRLSIIHTTEDFHIRSDCNEAHRTYWIRYQSQPFPKGLQITHAPAIYQFSTWADLLAHSFLPPSIKVFLGPVLNQHSNVLRLYFLKIWIITVVTKMLTNQTKAVVLSQPCRRSPVEHHSEPPFLRSDRRFWPVFKHMTRIFQKPLYTQNS